jgi:MalT-like TPR region
LTAERELDDLLAGLAERDLVEAEEISTISGESAFRFRHALVCDVAYSSMSKAARARAHRTVAGWLGERAPDELLEICAYHLDRACVLLSELETELPQSLVAEAAAALERAGDRAFSRESFASARRLYLRASTLAPTVERRYLAAHTSLQLGDLATSAIESEAVRADAVAIADHRIEGRALCDLAAVALARGGDPSVAARLAEDALGVLAEEEADARIDAYRRLAVSAWWRGRSREAESYYREMLALADRAGRPDLGQLARRGLVWLHELRLELDAAEVLLSPPAPTGGGPLERARSTHAVGSLRRLQGRLVEAKTALAEARSLFLDAGVSGEAAQCRLLLGWIGILEGDFDLAESEFREAVRVLEAGQDYGRLCEAERGLAETMLERGHFEEAERYALAARVRVTDGDLTSFSATLKTLGLVRAAQGRHDEAEALLRESLEVADGTDFLLLRNEMVVALADFLRLRERVAEAEELERRLPERVSGWFSAADRSRPRGARPRGVFSST